MNELPPPSPGIGRDKDIITLNLAFEFSAEAPRLFAIIGDEGQWPEELSPRILKSQPNSKIVAALSDFTRLEFNFTSRSASCEVTLFHDLIKSSDARNEYVKIWNDWFQVLANRVSL